MHTYGETIEEAEGSMDISFRATLGVVLLAFVAQRAYYSRKYPPLKEETTDEMQGGWASVVATVLGIGGVISLILFLVAPGSISWASLPIPVWLRWAGVIPVAAGFGLLQWSHVALGANWSDTPRTTRGQALVTHGPYQWIRHPIYAAFLLILGAPLLIAANWFLGGCFIAMTTVDVHGRIRYEEETLWSRFGPAYVEHVKRTGVLLPRL